jgi:hypothetical protein
MHAQDFVAVGRQRLRQCLARTEERQASIHARLYCPARGSL